MDVNVNLNLIPEIVLQEDYHELSRDVVNHNDLREEDSEVDMEIDMEISDDDNVQDLDGLPVSNVGGGSSSYFMQPPADEFADISWSGRAVDSQWVPWDVQEQDHCKDLPVGAQFRTKAELMNAVKMFHIKQHVQFRVTHSNVTRVILKCKQEDRCKWKLRASVPDNADYFRIGVHKGPHTCSNPILNQDHKQLDSTFVGQCIKDTVKAQLNLNCNAIIAMMKEQYHYTISYRKAWLAKQHAMVLLFGDWEDSYQILPAYLEEVQKSNPGTAVVWCTEPTDYPGIHKLKRVFWAFGSCIEAFRYCRPVICVDATHLYGKYKGKLMIAVAVDANQQIMPLAFAVTEGENKDSWGWFMACLRVHVTDRDGLCVISDRHPGIISAMQNPHLGWAEPRAYHRYCYRHYVSNFNSAFKNKALKERVGRMAKATQIHKLNLMLSQFENIEGGKPKKWLNKTPLEYWTLARDGGRRYGSMTSNFVEVFNNVLKGARGLPITALVQLTFYRVNGYFTDRRMNCEEYLSTGAMFSPYVELELQRLGRKSSAHEVIMYHHRQGVFEVKTAPGGRMRRGHGGRVHIVDLCNATCSCNKWTIYHFPCSHLMAVCAARNLSYHQFVDPCYSMHNYVSTWAPMFNPIPDKVYWPTYCGPTLIPDASLLRSNRGRPVSTRIHNEMDEREGERTPALCGLCRNPGHNRRACPFRGQ